MLRKEIKSRQTDEAKVVYTPDVSYTFRIICMAGNAEESYGRETKVRCYQRGKKMKGKYFG